MEVSVGQLEGGSICEASLVFMGRLLDGICFAVSRIHLPLMLSFELLWYRVEKENKRLKEVSILTVELVQFPGGRTLLPHNGKYMTIMITQVLPQKYIVRWCYLLR